jgi:hypothetical protein
LLHANRGVLQGKPRGEIWHWRWKIIGERWILLRAVSILDLHLSRLFLGIDRDDIRGFPVLNGEWSHW